MCRVLCKYLINPIQRHQLQFCTVVYELMWNIFKSMQYAHAHGHPPLLQCNHPQFIYSIPSNSWCHKHITEMFPVDHVISYFLMFFFPSSQYINSITNMISPLSYPPVSTYTMIKNILISWYSWNTSIASLRHMEIKIQCMYTQKHKHRHTIFIRIEAQAFISYKWLLTRHLYEPFPHFI